MWRFLFSVCALFLPLVAAQSLNQTGCGNTKGCLFKPIGCDPATDCTVGVVFTVTSDNWLDIEMTAQQLEPAVDMQFIAIGFSRDAHMGDDAVTECVISTNAGVGAAEPQVYLSYNKAEKANTRLELSDEERKVLIKNIAGSVANGRINCRFSQQIVATQVKENIWALNEDYYILAATGAAQPNGINAHDTNSQSHFFPALSTAAINPAKVASGAGAASGSEGPSAGGPPAVGPQTGPGFGPKVIPQSPQGPAGSGPPQAQPEPEPEHEPGHDHEHDHEKHSHEHDVNGEATTPLNGSGYVSLASAVLLLCLLVAQ
uniref:DOMON domain-containing protein n=1 Tax=Plectus sambesii TaxID=2011161 RepID=A0A914VS41_9BILA